MNVLMDGDAVDLAEAQAGRSDALARLYDRHAPIVYALCRRGFTADPDDAAQETFIRAFGKLDQLDDPTRFRPWLYAIAGNVCSEKRRAADRRLKHESDAMHNGMLQRERSDDGHSNRFEHREQIDRLTDAMEQLSDEERLALHMHYLERDPKQAAIPALGTSRSGYYRLLKQARSRLALILGEKPNPKEVNR